MTITAHSSVDSEDPSETVESSYELTDLLSDPHVRSALAYLQRTDGPVDLATLARHVVAQILDEPPDEVPKDVVRRVQTWLHHGHLPALDQYGLVEYDSENMLVSILHPGNGPWLTSDGL